MESTELFLKHYHKHIQTPGFGVPGQEALLKSKVLVIGAGTLAAPVLSYLSSMGVGFLGVVCDDIIRKEDLPGQPFYFRNDEGKSMGQTAVRQLRAINPDLNITLYEKALDSSNGESIISQYDLVIDCGNNLQQSYLINDACILTGKPMVYGALFPPTGYVSVFNYKGSGTLKCLLAEPAIARLYRQEPVGGLSVLPAITGSLMVNEAVKIIGEIGTVVYNKLLTFNSFTNQLEAIPFFTKEENKSISALQNNTGPVQQQDVQPSPTHAIQPKLLQLKMKYKETLQLIDVSHKGRVSDHWNCLHIPEDALLERSEEIHQDIIVVLISENGESAKKLCGILNEKYGFSNIYYLEGGLEQWERETNSSRISYESF